MLECNNRSDAVVRELVLVELYVLLRNPSVFKKPLSSTRAAEICKAYRQNPKWWLVENAPVMESVWEKVNRPGFPRRRIFDIRLALTLKHHGVTALATGNIKDFQDLGLHRVWEAVAPGPFHSFYKQVVS